jgi:formylglycine-generating enzyme required for sulfatase activity
VEQKNSIGIKLVLLPPGEFMMGSTPEQIAEAKKMSEALNDKLDQWMLDRLDDEGPAHRVSITRPYLIGATEVTVGQFRSFIDASGYVTEGERYGGGNSKVMDEKDAKKKELTWRSPGFDVTENSNVSQVTWNDATAFCNWLSERENHVPCYRTDQEAGWLLNSSSSGYRLPTEAEWEYACRAGTKTQFSFGDDPADFPKYGWKERFGPIPRPISVAAKLPNAFGLYDMHGNAFEWCHDWYGRDYYATSPVDDPTGSASPFGGWCVLRGGHYGWLPLVYCRSAYRAAAARLVREAEISFRVVCVLANEISPLAAPPRNPATSEPVSTLADNKPPKPAPPPSRQFLSELREQDVVVNNDWGSGGFGKGQNTADRRPLIAAGKASPHGIFMHALGDSFASVRYDLGRRAKQFNAHVGLDHPDARTPLVFQVYGDDKLLWTSAPMRPKDGLAKCEVSLDNVRFLELRVNCAGDSFCAHAVWFEPEILWK